jgi:hypothetical protein
MMLERSSSQLLLSHNDSHNYNLTTKCGELDESSRARNLPIISESTEKLCALKLKQFGMINKVRNEIPVIKSCIIESFEEDFASTQNSLFKKASEKPAGPL